jgi:hypothetical protein
MRDMGKEKRSFRMERRTGIGTGCTNKPIWPSGSQIGVGWPSHRWRRRLGLLRQTNPICAGAGFQGSATRHPIPGPRPPGLSCETKPIGAKAKQRTSAVQIRSCDKLNAGVASEKQSQFRVGSAGSGPTKGPCRRRDQLYKQTQFAPRTETGIGRRSRPRGCRWDLLRQTNPISRSRRARLGSPLCRKRLTASARTR